jgi:hypothetical protein
VLQHQEVSVWHLQSPSSPSSSSAQHWYKNIHTHTGPQLMRRTKILRTIRNQFTQDCCCTQHTTR